jgi:DnaJ homolog subfamily C member 8
MQLESTATVAEIKTKYKRLSFIVHPDKNIDDKERAQNAFEMVNKAWKELENDVTRNKCLEKYEEAEQKLNIMLAAKRKQLKKEGKSDILKEDQDPEAFKHSKYVLVMKLFAESQRKRELLDTRNQEIRKRQREQEIEEEDQKQKEKEYLKNFEESR